LPQINLLEKDTLSFFVILRAEVALRLTFLSRQTRQAKAANLEKLFNYYSVKREEFLTPYHKRSNMETTFSMIKAKFVSICEANRNGASKWSTLQSAMS